jgi:short subunit dehydrogenase-like uncharacterized protein
MGAVNTRVVRRTQALLGMRYDYQEYSRFKTASTARNVTLGTKAFESILGSGLGRLMVKPWLPKPGAGPSEKVMNEGFFECQFVGTTTAGARVKGVMLGQGDAGNRITVKCLCESAFVLALSAADESVGQPGSGGVLTPVTGLGEALVPRLATAGINFAFI